MKKTHQVPLALVLLVVLSACSESHYSAPMAPTAPTAVFGPSAPAPPNGPGSGTIAIRGLSPAPGTTLTVQSDCPAFFPGYPLQTCTDKWHGTFEVTIDREMTYAQLIVSFFDGQTKCGFGFAVLDVVPAGRPVSFSIHRVVVVKDDSPAQPCRLPVTTNRIEAELWSDSSTWTNTLIQLFEGGYTFSEP